MVRSSSRYPAASSWARKVAAETVPVASSIAPTRVSHGPRPPSQSWTAAVELDEQTLLGHPLAPAAVARWTASPGTGDPGGAQDPPHGDPPEDDALVLSEELRQVAVGAARIAAMGELDDPRRHGRLDPSRGGSPAIAVDQARRSVHLEGRPQPPDLPLGQPEQTGRLRRGQFMAFESIEDPRSPLLDRAHRDRLHLRRLTKSLIS
jgi:hypothetical protein